MTIVQTKMGRISFSCEKKGWNYLKRIRLLWTNWAPTTLQFNSISIFITINENCPNWVLTANWVSRIIPIIAASKRHTIDVSTRITPLHSHRTRTIFVAFREFSFWLHTTLCPPPCRRKEKISELLENKTCSETNKIYSVRVSLWPKSLQTEEVVGTGIIFGGCSVSATWVKNILLPSHLFIGVWIIHVPTPPPG